LGMGTVERISATAAGAGGSRLSGFPWNYLVIGLLIREALAPFTGHPYDFEIWVRLGKSLMTNPNPYVYLNYTPGLSLSPYGTLGSIAYLPLSGYVFGGTYALYALLGEPTRYLYYFLLKQPMVISDLLVSVVLFRIISSGRVVGSARRAALLWLFLPLSFFTSTLWGSLDSVVILLTLVALYLFQENRYVWSSIALAFAIFYKQSALIFLPVFLLQRGLSWKQRAYYCAIALAIPALGTLVPAYIYNWQLSNMYNGLAWQTVLPVFGAMSIFNPLVAVKDIPALFTQGVGLIWVPMVLASYYFIYKRRTPLVEGMLFTFLAFCVLRPFLPENWTGYALAFLLIIGTQDSYLRFATLSTVAQFFFITNNTLLIRFFTPISLNFFNWDLYLNNYVLAEPRFILMFLLAILYFIEAVAIIWNKPSPLGRLRPMRSFADWLTPAEVC